MKYRKRRKEVMKSEREAYNRRVEEGVRTWSKGKIKMEWRRMDSIEEC